MPSAPSRPTAACGPAFLRRRSRAITAVKRRFPLSGIWPELGQRVRRSDKPDMMPGGPSSRLEDDALAVLAVHLDDDRPLVAQVANVGRLASGGLGPEPGPVDESIAGVGVDREVADVE